MCVPPSGNLFAVGDHTVTCTASDARSNSSSTTFVVHVTLGSGNSVGPPSTARSVRAWTASAAHRGVLRRVPGVHTPGAMGTCAVTTGGSCNDGNACTQTDTCQAGVCTGANPVDLRRASDQCHVAGTCNPATGACSNPAKAERHRLQRRQRLHADRHLPGRHLHGREPGRPARASDQCHVAGHLQPGDRRLLEPGQARRHAPATTATPARRPTPARPASAPARTRSTCTASDQCHVAGTCDPATGVCSNPAKRRRHGLQRRQRLHAGRRLPGGRLRRRGRHQLQRQNLCTVDSCNPATGCTNAPGNAGASAARRRATATARRPAPEPAPRVRRAPTSSRRRSGRGPTRPSSATVGGAGLCWLVLPLAELVVRERNECNLHLDAGQQSWDLRQERDRRLAAGQPLRRLLHQLHGQGRRRKLIAGGRLHGDRAATADDPHEAAPLG